MRCEADCSVRRHEGLEENVNNKTTRDHLARLREEIEAETGIAVY